MLDWRLGVKLSRVGKTSILERYVKDRFASTYRITVGADLFSQDIEVDERKVTLQVL